MARIVGGPRLPFWVEFVPSRRLEDKIRHLCVLSMQVKNEDAWLILSELRTLPSQHIEHLRMVAAGNISGTRAFVARRSGPPAEKDPLIARIPGT
jgi:hypothetical protein